MNERSENVIRSTDPNNSRFFKKADLEMEGFEAEIVPASDGEQEYVILRELGLEGDLRLYVREARKLRDWLNKAVP